MRFFLLLAAATPLWADPPVIFTSSHIGSFFTFARLLPSDAALTLVQLDAHDDAMALTESRTVRRRLWIDGRLQESVLRTLDAGQYIEGYNWIEALMPHPLGALVWVAPKDRLTSGARERISESLNHEVRRQGEDDLLVSVADGPNWGPPSGPWVLSIDLDSFAEDPGALEPTLRDMLRRSLVHPPMVVTVAVSQPYLPSETMAESFVTAAWLVILDVTPWSVRVDPRVNWGGRDRGQEERLAAQGRTWQEFNFEKVRHWAAGQGRGRIVYGSGNPN